MHVVSFQFAVTICKAMGLLRTLAALLALTACDPRHRLPDLTDLPPPFQVPADLHDQAILAACSTALTMVSAVARDPETFQRQTPGERAEFKKALEANRVIQARADLYPDDSRRPAGGTVIGGTAMGIGGFTTVEVNDVDWTPLEGKSIQMKTGWGLFPNPREWKRLLFLRGIEKTADGASARWELDLDFDAVIKAARAREPRHPGIIYSHARPGEALNN
jgi:hypothetical protein